MEAPQAPIGCSLACDRVIFEEVTAQVINFLAEVDGLLLEQELIYHKLIASQLRTQYTESIYRPKYYTVTLKSRLRVTVNEPLDRSYTT